MAKWSFKSATWTPAAVADTTAFTDKGYMAIQAGSTTQRIAISEIYLGGQAVADAACIMIVARDSVVGATLTALGAGESNAPNDPATAALAAPQQPFTGSTTKPQRSATLGLLNLSFNAYGGIVRWVAPQGGELWLLGNAANAGEISLSAFTGGAPGLIGAHLVYEPL